MPIFMTHATDSGDASAFGGIYVGAVMEPVTQKVQCDIDVILHIEESSLARE